MIVWLIDYAMEKLDVVFMSQKVGIGLKTLISNNLASVPISNGQLPQPQETTNAPHTCFQQILDPKEKAKTLSRLFTDFASMVSSKTFSPRHLTETASSPAKPFSSKEYSPHL